MTALQTAPQDMIQSARNTSYACASCNYYFLAENTCELQRSFLASLHKPGPDCWLCCVATQCVRLPSSDTSEQIVWLNVFGPQWRFLKFCCGTWRSPSRLHCPCSPLQLDPDESCWASQCSYIWTLSTSCFSSDVASLRCRGQDWAIRSRCFSHIRVEFNSISECYGMLSFMNFN